MKRALMMLLTVMLLSVSTFAQGPVVVPRGATFIVEWESEYPNTGTYRFATFIDNTQTKVWTQTELTATARTPVTDCGAAATACFTYRGTHPGLQNTGTRVLKNRVTEAATALNSAFSPEVSFIVGSVPNAPSLPRIVVVTTQAGVTFEFKSAPVTVDQAQAQEATVVRIPVRR